MNFGYRLMRFFSGRYGRDSLNDAIWIVAVILSVVNLFLRLYTLQIVVYLTVGYAIFRLMSRNFEARRKENAWFLKRFGAIKRAKEIRDQRKADFCHVYKKCPRCKAVLRLPRRIGVHKTVCPRCSKEFTVKVKK